MRATIFTCLFLLATFASGQAGDNAVQYLELDDYEWKVIESDHFAVYFDARSEEGARRAMKYASQNLKMIEDKIGYRLSGLIEIIYFNSLYDLNRSSMNRETAHSDINTGGITSFTNSIFPVYQSVSGKDLMIQIKRGIAGVLVNEMIYEGTVQERIKYNTLLHLPVWFVEGLSEYIASGWDEEADDLLRSALEMDRFRNMNMVTREEEILAGRSIWKFIDDRRDDLTVPRLLYLVRLTRKVESAVFFIFNWSTKDLFNEWESFYRGVYSLDNRRRLPAGEEVIGHQYLQGKISSVKLSPDGSKIAFLAYFNGKYQLVIHHRDVPAPGQGPISRIPGIAGLFHESGPDQVWDEIKAFTAGEIYNPYRMVFEWKNNETIYTAVQVNSGTELSEISRKGKLQVMKLTDIQNISGLAYDGQKTLLAVASGHSGGTIYRLDTETGRSEKVLADSSDYFEPVFDRNGPGFYFTRSMQVQDDTLPNEWDSDVGYYRFSDRSVTWIANDKKYNEYCPLPYGNSAISFLSDENGISNAYLFDGEQTVGLTDYQHNILIQTNAGEVQLVAEMLYFNGRNHIYVSEQVSRVDALSLKIYAAPTWFAANRTGKSRVATGDSASAVEEERPAVKSVIFQTDFPNDNIDSILSEHEKTKIVSSEAESRRYHLKWLPTHIITQFHNGLLNTNRFAAYRTPQASFANPFGIHLAVAITDVHKSHMLTGGIKTNSNLYRLEFYSHYENRRKRLVKSAGVWRNAYITTTREQLYFRNLSNDFSASLKYPLLTGLTLGTGAGFRKDARIFLSSGSESLSTRNLEQKLARIELFATLDKTRNKQLNTYEGILARVQTEYQFRLDGQGDFGAASLNVRYGTRLANLLYWMNKLEANHSYGPGQMRYFTGGMENWIDPGIKTATYLSDRYTTYLVPVYGVRGFQYNARNGNTSITFNTEVRYQLGKKLFRRSGQSEFLENIMITAFADVGSAWYGRSPYDRKNPLNSRTIETGALLIKVYNPKDPLIYGLGGGIRTALFSYYLKWDIALGRDNGKWLDHINYLTIGKDF